jgi:hypothetical protein
MGIMLLTHRKIQGECESSLKLHTHTHTHTQILMSFCGVEGSTKKKLSLDTKGSR